MRLQTPGAVRQDCQRDSQRIHGASSRRDSTNFLLPSITLHLFEADQLSDRRLPALLLQLAAVRLLDPEEPAGAEGEGQGCERRFFSQVHGDAMHLSGDE